MKLRSARRVVALAVSGALLLGAAPAVAIAADRGPITGSVTYQGTSLTGMSESEARAFLGGATDVPALGPLAVTAAGRKYSFDARSAVVVDLDRMLSLAYSITTTTTPTEIAPSYKLRGSVVSSWITSMASAVNRPTRNAWWLRSGRRMLAVPEVPGRRVNPTTTGARITSAINSSLASQGGAIPGVSASVSYFTPAVTRRNIGKAIVVDLSERKVYLWRPSGLEKTYRCAVGMPGFSTPRGSFKVYAKVKNPTWRNPGSAWAVDMPAYIPPGPTNPLGTRALYINSPGIRIHGTSNYASIGTAASHGCMRLRNPDVEDLYPRVPIGTPVRIIP